jgi:hypothetical protein
MFITWTRHILGYSSVFFPSASYAGNTSPQIRDNAYVRPLLSDRWSTLQFIWGIETFVLFGVGYSPLAVVCRGNDKYNKVSAVDSPSFWCSWVPWSGMTATPLYTSFCIAETPKKSLLTELNDSNSLIRYWRPLQGDFENCVAGTGQLYLTLLYLN